MFYEFLYGKNDLVAELDKSLDCYDFKALYAVCDVLHSYQKFI